jgi:hypothetical protein
MKAYVYYEEDENPELELYLHHTIIEIPERKIGILINKEIQWNWPSTSIMPYKMSDRTYSNEPGKEIEVDDKLVDNAEILVYDYAELEKSLTELGMLEKLVSK